MKSFSSLARQSLTAVCVLLVLTTSAQARTARTNSARVSQDNRNVCTTDEREKKLFEAINLWDSARVDELLASGVSPNAHALMNYESWQSDRPTCATALMHAARAGNEKIVESLLNAKADVSALDNLGRYIWGYAFGLHALKNIPTVRLQDELSARLRITKRLIAAGAKLDAQDPSDYGDFWRNTALFHAAAAGIITGDLRILQMVITAGATVKNTEVIAYATKIAQEDLRGGRGAPGAEQVVRTLLDNGGDVNRHGNGPTALMMEARGWELEGSPRRIKVLLAAGADVNAQQEGSGETALLIALKNHNIMYGSPSPQQRAAAPLWAEVVKLLLSAGADPNKSDKEGNSPLPSSFDFSWLLNFPSESEAVFKALIAAGADINSRGPYGNTILSLAVSNGAYYEGSYRPTGLQILKTLIAAGADVNARNKDGMTPLYLAAKSGGRDIEEAVKILLAAGADVNLAENNGETPLMAALTSLRSYNAPQESINLVRLLIDAKPNVNAKNRTGETALMLALHWNATAETIRTLIDAGADVNLTNDAGEHSLIVAARNHREDEILQILLGAGARVDLINASGDTALMVAANVYIREWPVSRDGRLFKTLVAAGADATLLNHEGESALTILVTKSGTDALPSIRALLEAAGRKGARNYPRAADFLIAIRRAAGNSPADVVQELIKAGADVNAVDESGRPALLVAADESGNPAVVRALVAAGARVNAKNNEGDTALIAAVREYLPVRDEFIQNALHRNMEVVRVLLDAGADPRRRGRDGQSAIKLADKSGNQTLIDMFEKGARHRTSRH